jgi:tetratricopeptide (TPR) repeat protein
MDKSLESQILSMAGDCLSANNDLENAAVSYNYAAEFSKSPENIERAAMAYYKLSKKSKVTSREREYMEKAESLFKKAIYTDPQRIDSHYYLGMIYSERGDLVNAVNEFEILQGHPEEFSEKVVTSVIESYIFLKQARYEKESEAYLMLEDPFLVSFYEFIKQYIVETDIEKELLAKHSTSNAYSAIAMEIRDMYDRYFMDKGIKEKIPNPVIRFGLIIGLMFSKKGREKELLDFFSQADFSDLRGLPVYTRGIVSDFLSKFGLTKQSFKMPYTIQQNISATEKVIGMIKQLREERIGKEGIRDMARDVYPYLRKENAKDYASFFETVGNASYGEIYNRLESLKGDMVETIFRKLRAFYGKEETVRIFRLIISSLELGEEEKVKILKRTEYAVNA